MLEELLKKCFDEESAADKSAENIKTAVLSRIEEDKPMKKRFKIKPLIIIAAVISTMALSAVSVNAATNGAFFSKFFNTSATKTFSTKYGDICIDFEASRDDNGNERTKVAFDYSHGFSGTVVRYLTLELEDEERFLTTPRHVYNEERGQIYVAEMSDGGTLGFRFIYPTSEISSLTDEEIQYYFKEYKSEVLINTAYTAETE